MDEEKDISIDSLKEEISAIDSMVALAWNQKPSAKTHKKIQYSRDQLKKILTQKVAQLQAKVIAHYSLSAAIKEHPDKELLQARATEIFNEAIKKI